MVMHNVVNCLGGLWLCERLQEFKGPSSSMYHSASHQAGRGRHELVYSPSHRSCLEKVHGCLKTHLLQRRAVCFQSHTIERLVGSLKCHVVSNEREMAMVNCNIVHLEHTGYLLQEHALVFTYCLHIPTETTHDIWCAGIPCACHHSHKYERLTWTIAVAAASIPYVAAMECMLLVYTRFTSSMSACFHSS